MKKIIMIAFVSFLSVSSYAKKLEPVDLEKIADKLKQNDTRTAITKVNNPGENPCLPLGSSYQIELQLKRATYDRINNKVNYFWESVKTVNVSESGEVIEVCAE